MATAASGLRTQSGAILGTPSYMAPEQASGKSKGVGPAADVWALGALLYECLTGRPPFRGESTLDTLMQVATEEPPPPHQLQPACPPDLEAVCIKCLEKDPKRRYESAGALADDLQRFLDGQPTTARPRQPQAGFWRRLRRQRKLTYAAAGALLLGCLALLLLVLRRPSEDAATRDKEEKGAVVLARRQQSQNNLKQLALALQHISAEYKYMPPAALCDPQSGKPLLSWRVAVLPYIGEARLYSQFKRNEPWDSRHNIRLLGQMPKVFAVEGMQAKPGYTHYQLFVGPGTPFDPRFAPIGGPFGRQGPRYPASFTDGVSNTILIAEAAEAVPWTKPQDIDYDPRRPVPELGIFYDGFNVALADGEAWFIRNSISQKTLHAVITAAGAEIPGSDWRDDTRHVADEDLGPHPESLYATVSGKVTYKGRPLTAGQVIFENEKGGGYGAPIEPDASYRRSRDMPVGEYKVVVVSVPGGGIKVPAKYADTGKTPLSCTLRRGPNVFDVNLED
jgi:hypothetical protein